jgi:hypothetical protein
MDYSPAITGLPITLRRQAADGDPNTDLPASVIGTAAHSDWSLMAYTRNQRHAAARMSLFRLQPPLYSIVCSHALGHL